MEVVAIKCTVNGREHRLECEANLTLLDMLRESLGLTGTKSGCAVGECGACTVVMNGEAVNACLVLAAQVDGADILTVEGLQEDGVLDPLQEMFIRHGAVQCGFCTPGMLMSAKALLNGNPDPTEEEIRVAISGNLCRCTGYQQIVEAISAASAKEKSREKKEGKNCGW
ncbi:MAG: (2Fe-2S)-binding protein [Candidatus Eisenbacteria sp.]|nr:(2Fe-2S)-binding protein [Candidatus Eisenbacteria bacterium]